jgi:hypothetical protein
MQSKHEIPAYMRQVGPQNMFSQMMQHEAELLLNRPCARGSDKKMFHATVIVTDSII